MIRLQKLLAGSGVASRRAVEEWIRAGRLTVNGRTAQLGDRARSTDTVCLDGRRLELGCNEGPAELLLYYKPLGEVTTRSDPEGRPTVFERLPAPAAGRWIAVGRLDVNTSGLLLLTTDGELAHRLMHPSSEVEREYRVRLRGRPGPEVLEKLRSGVLLEDGPARFDRICAEAPGDGVPGSHSSFHVVLHEGRNREVRRLWQAVGFEVSRLARLRYGPIELPQELKPGGTLKANATLLSRLRQAAGVSGPASQGGPAPPGRGPRRPAGARPPSK
jgi:23S rRNA pseudouridine2605 synthase